MEATTQQVIAPQDNRRAGWGSYVAAVLLPIVGVILAIVQFARGNTGPGFALLLTSTIAFFFWATILIGAAADDYQSCIDGAKNLHQQLKC